MVVEADTGQRLFIVFCVVARKVKANGSAGPASSRPIQRVRNLKRFGGRTPKLNFEFELPSS